ncbi:MAG: WxcM-like domain-containing protein [Chlorobiaceae bacterium]|nr:WxcM-like domain-containing protein [Chlorobiaceae bacterium]NTW73725.1 WxcM-like domain-containing protein [Chlorobiaceae bacterium]
MEKISVTSSVYDCSIVHLPKVHNRTGNITALENGKTIPFSVNRVYYLYDVPGGADRGGHAHRNLQQFIVSVSGAFDVLLDDGTNKKIVRLDRPYIGLHIVPGIWREIIDFSSGAICLVLASEKYDEQDYIRDYKEFGEFRAFTGSTEG